jgi:diguanylate cyclase (GGDEF)-like protein
LTGGGDSHEVYSEIHTREIAVRCVSAIIRETLNRYIEIAGAPFEAFFDALPADHKRHMAVVAAEPGGSFRYKHYGQAIVDVTGFDMSGKCTSDFDSEVGRFFSRVYTQALTEQQPIFTLHRASHALNVHVWERLVLPLAARTGEAILVAVIIPREFKAEFLQAVLASSPDAIFALRSLRDGTGRIIDGIIVAANDRFALPTGRTVEQLEGCRLMEVMPGHSGSELWRKYVQVIETRQPDIFEAEYYWDGLNGCYRISAAPLGDGVNVCFTDITTLKTAIAGAEAALRNAEAAREELRRQSITDHLTGILNRYGFDTRLMRFYDEQLLHHASFAVIAIDVDRFKEVNDVRGHAAGDKVLKGLANILSAETRADQDILGRMGGEEFMIILPSATLADAAALAERIRTRLARTAFHSGTDTFFVTASFGVWQASKKEALQSALRGADEALYRAKHAGRNVVVSAESRSAIGASLPNSQQS